MLAGMKGHAKDVGGGLLQEELLAKLLDAVEVELQEELRWLA